GNYKEAIKLYKEKLYDDPHNALTNYMVGACLYYANEINEADYYLSDAQELPGAVFMKGDIYAKQYDFAQAAAYYERAAKMVSQKSFLYDACARRLQGIENARKLLKSVEKVTIIDSMTVGKKYFFSYYSLSDNAGILYQHKGNSADYSAPYTGYMTQREDRRIYSDSSNNQCDIFVQDKLIDGWSKGRKLPDEINTPGDENFPFLQEDGITLYFGSTRHGSLGGYDIFVSRYSSDNSGYMSPLQISMPFNSPWNDYLMAIDENKGIGHWATDRFISGDSVKIYTFKYESQSVFLPESISDAERLQYAKMKKFFVPQPETAQTTPEPDTVALVRTDTAATAIDSVATAKTDTTVAVEEVKPQQTTIKTSGFEFKITDEITYTKLDDFLSGEAKAYYQQGAKLQAERNANIETLDRLRAEYASAYEVAERKKISTEILKIERRLGTSTKIAYENYFKLSRNNEIKAINNKRKQDLLKQQQ
ncbi:MAG: PD40 domain-containing protein, partial [Paludibacteraceae bacterium]|nr:PD40 domain-containing protein [Paludibacteraceae bacterium]